MKKLIYILIACLLMTACANKEVPHTTGEPMGTTLSTVPTAVSTPPAETTTPPSSVAIQETEATSTISDDASSAPEATSTVSDNTSSVPEEDTLTRFTLYTPNENADGFIAKEVEGDKLTPLEVLIEAGVLTEDVRMNFVKWESDIMTIDFNTAFRDLLLSQGTAGEKMLIGSVVNTFLSAYQMESMMITVEEEILESGHIIYDFPMGYFE